MSSRLTEQELDQRRNIWYAFVENHPNLTTRDLFRLWRENSGVSYFLKKTYAGIHHALFDGVKRNHPLSEVSLEQFLPFVHYIACGVERVCKKIQPSLSILDDLVQDGYVGLMEGVTKLDQTKRDHEQASYLRKAASRHMTGSVYAQITPVSMHQNSLLPLVLFDLNISPEEIENVVFKKHRWEYVLRDLQKYKKRYHKILTALSVERSVSLEMSYRGEDNGDLRDVLSDLIGKHLSEREHFVVEQRYSEGETLEDIGQALKITRERVRQIELIALEKLKRKIRARDRWKSVSFEYFGEWLSSQ